MWNSRFARASVGALLVGSACLGGPASTAVAVERINPTTDNISPTSVARDAEVISTEGLDLIVNRSASLPQSQLALLAPTFTCDLNVQYPHGSTHVSGTINVVSRVNCTAAPAMLQLDVSLKRTSLPQKTWYSPRASNLKQSSIQSNRAVSCSEGPGNFQGWARGIITPPPGYKLQGPPDYSKWGKIVFVICGPQMLQSMTNIPSVGETVTFTFVREDLASANE